MNTLFFYKLAKLVTIHKGIKPTPAGGIKATKIKASPDKPVVKSEEVKVEDDKLKILQKAISGDQNSEVTTETQFEENIDV